MRSGLLFVVLLCLACNDNVVGPNTDVGLSVWAEVSPPTASISDIAATLRIRVYVSNESFKEIRVVSGGPPYVFTNDPNLSKGLWGSMRIANDADPLNAGPSVDWWGNAVYAFPPRYSEYNEDAITLKEWKARGWPLVAGRFRVRSWFNGREGRSATFQLTP